MQEFEIGMKTLRSELIKSDQGISSEQIKAHLAHNIISRIPEAPKYRLRDQTFIPHYALDMATSKFHFRDSIDNGKLEIVDMEFPKLSPVNIGNNVSNNINIIVDYMFNYWTVQGYNNLLKVPFVYNGQQRHLFIAPGMLIDSEGKILCSLVYKKELITKLNLIEGFDKFRDFYSLFSKSARQSLGVGLEDFINENALIIFSKEFTIKQEYSRFFKNISAIFVSGLRYSVDTIVSDTVEKHIWNLPIDTKMDVNFNNMKEKLDYCREILKKSILT